MSTDTKQATIITAELQDADGRIHAQWSAGIVFEGDLCDYVRGLRIRIAGIPPGGGLDDFALMTFTAENDGSGGAE